VGSSNPESKRRGARGQVLVMVSIAVPVLILFAGLAIDFGVAYTDKTALSRAVDAAALEGMRNLSAGTTMAQRLAQDTYNLDVQALGAYSTSPAFSFAENTDAYGNESVTVNGTVYWNPIFLRFVLGSTVPISDTATVSRAPLYMSLVLDQSYSMTENGGSTALAPAVTNFIDQFNDSLDHVAVVSFATHPTVGVTMASSPPFKSAVTTYADAMTFSSTNAYTFAQTGLDNGLAQINSVSLPTNAQKVIVFFTDGWPNMIQSGLNCSGSTDTTLNFTSCDPGDDSLGLCSSATTPLVVFTTSGGNTTCGTCTSNTLGNPCTPSSTMVLSTLYFQSQQNGTTEHPTMNNVYNEAIYRAEASATTALNQNVTIYSIGLGTAITNQTTAQDFLYQVANDPNGPSYNSALPQGEAVFAPTSSQLNYVFEEIASKILLRITQ
jgi:Flp pilus assembly protein TadG